VAVRASRCRAAPSAGAERGALSQFVEGLGLRRSVQNDLAANLLGTVSPPPGDVVIRVAMFGSWGVSALEGMAGVTLNMLTF
jgi:hypothetical protein